MVVIGIVIVMHYLHFLVADTEHSQPLFANTTMNTNMNTNINTNNVYYIILTKNNTTLI